MNKWPPSRGDPPGRNRPPDRDSANKRGYDPDSSDGSDPTSDGSSVHIDEFGMDQTIMILIVSSFLVGVGSVLWALGVGFVGALMVCSGVFYLSLVEKFDPVVVE